MLSIYGAGIAAAVGMGTRAAAEQLASGQPPVATVRTVSGQDCKGLFAPGLPAPALTGGRRFSPWLRLSLAAAREAVASQPGLDCSGLGIVSATGWGSLQHTAGFMENMIRNQESEPQPANFIFSVHNAAATQVAIALAARGLNYTLSSLDISFEQALLAAASQEQAGPAQRLLVFGADEWQPLAAMGLQQAHYWKVRTGETLPLPGEGAGALLVGPETPGTVRIRGIECQRLRSRHGRTSPAEERQAIEQFLQASGLRWQDIDVILTSESGVPSWDAGLTAVWDRWPETLAIPRWPYKRWTGEFPTAPACALVLAVLSLSAGLAGWRTVFFYNRSRFENRSMVILQK
jgi:3-oxoacyl-(acyl-carrier-protein) synthase